MKNTNCPYCGEKQWSIADCNYVVLYGICRSCDRRKWFNQKLSLEEFEKREKEAILSNPLCKECETLKK